VAASQERFWKRFRTFSEAGHDCPRKPLNGSTAYAWKCKAVFTAAVEFLCSPSGSERQHGCFEIDLVLFGIRPGQVEVHRLPAEVRENIGDTDARANLAICIKRIISLPWPSRRSWAILVPWRHEENSCKESSRGFGSRWRRSPECWSVHSSRLLSRDAAQRSRLRTVPRRQRRQQAGLRNSGCHGSDFLCKNWKDQMIGIEMFAAHRWNGAAGKRRLSLQPYGFRDVGKNVWEWGCS